MIQSGNTLYLGGDFTSMGEWSGGGVACRYAQQVLMNWPNANKKARVSGFVNTAFLMGLVDIILVVLLLLSVAL
jgi:hypothetical protein